MLKSRLPLHHPEIHLDDTLEEFVHAHPFTASVKDVQTGRYRILNQAMSDRVNIPLEEYIGLTVHDIGEMMHYKDSVTQNVVDVDNQIATGMFPHLQYKHIIPNAHQFILVEVVTKKPVFSKNKKVIAILGYARDITTYIHPLLLFSLYQKYYPTRETIIQKFLRYLKLEPVFDPLPTEQELLTLLMMRDNPEILSIANKLQCSVSDIEHYQTQLSNKLPIMSLEAVLRSLEKLDNYKTVDG